MPAILPLLCLLLSTISGAPAQDLYVINGTTTNITSATNAYGSTFVGDAAGDSNNVLNVVNVGTLVSNTFSVYIGYEGSLNSMTIVSGGAVSASDSHLGLGTNSSGNNAVVTGSNSMWTSSGGLYIGGGGASNSLTIVAGGSVSASESHLGFGTSSWGNSVVVTGSNSIWTNSGNLFVGGGGASNSLTVADGGSVSASESHLGFGTNSWGNSVVVTGGNSLWTNSGNLFVGGGGASNSLTVADGGSVSANESIVGYGTNATGNTVVVAGSNSTWTSAGNLFIGEGGGSNSLAISNGGSVHANESHIGFGADSSGNLVVVNGSNSTWTSAGNLFVGDAGSSNYLAISNGAAVAANESSIGFQMSSGSNMALVTGEGSTWTNAGNFIVGNAGAGNSLIISNGGDVFAGYESSIGFQMSSSNNEVLVTGPGSTWTSAAGLSVGSAGSGNSLTISNGAIVAANQGFVGSQATASNNYVLVTGSNSIWTNAGSLYVGNDGSDNRVEIVAGGALASGGAFIGSVGSNNRILVTGGGSVWTNTSALYVGDAGPGNGMVIADGGNVATAGLVIGQQTSAVSNTVVLTGGGSTLTNAGSLFVGGSSSGNSLTISNGAMVASDLDFVGSQATASNNYVLVTGSNSIWTNADSLRVGNDGSDNLVEVVAGGTLASGVAFIGVVGSNNRILVTGAGSVWTNTSALYVGDMGSGNSLIIADGGTMATDRIEIGYENSANSNTVVVTGGGSTLTNAANMFVGNSGSGNSLTISNGAMVAANQGFVGSQASASNNYVLVTGSNSIWTNAVFLFVGNAGSGNSLEISDGGNVFAANMGVGMGSDAANNRALVTGSNSLLSIREGQIGQGGSSNTLTVSNGGKVTNGWTYIGFTNSSSNNSVVVTGAGSRWDGEVDFNVGYNGSSNTLVVSDGGAVAHGGHFRGATLGFDVASSNNYALVTGSNSSWTSTAGFFVGYGGSGNSLVISNGGAVSNAFGHAGGAMIGRHTNASNNTVLVTGNNSSWTSSVDFFVGYAGSGNTLTITNGGRVAVDSASFVGFEQGSTGNTVVIAGTDSLWTNSASFVVGQEGSGNTLTIANGGNVASAGSSYVGNGSNATGNVAVLTGAGSRWTSGGNFWVGASGSSNTMSVLDGGLVSVGADGVVGGSIGASNNTLTIAGPLSQWTNRGNIYIGGGSNSVTVTNGGTLSVSGYTFMAPNAAEQGNSILVTGRGSEWTNTLNVYLGDGGSGNTLDVLDEGTVSLAENLAIGYYADASNNTVTVSGLGSSLASGATITVGREGNGNRVVVTNRGEVSAVGTQIGEQSNSMGNSVLVTGTNSRWANSGNLVVGQNGSGNSLTIEIGATVANTSGLIGVDANSSNNSVVVTGAGSTWTNSDDLYVGYDGSSNSMTIEDGATVANEFGYVGLQGNSFNNSVVVTGTNSNGHRSTWTNSGDLVVGQSGSSNSLVISNGGGVASVEGYIGFFGAALGNTVVVTGDGSVWSNIGSLSVGLSGSGNTLTISNGASVHNVDGQIGGTLGATDNSVTVTGTNASGSRSTWSNSGFVTIGTSGSSSSLTINDGAALLSSNAIIGNDASNNSVTVTGTGSEWANQDALWVGYFGSSNSVTVNQGGFVSVGGDTVLGTTDTSSNNSVLVTDVGSRWTNTGTLTVGYSGSGNSLLISDGGSVSVSSNSYIGFFTESSNNRVTVTDATWTNSGFLFVGGAGSGNGLVISNGANVANTEASIGNETSSSNNTVLVTDATWTNSGDLVVGQNGSGNSLVISNGGFVASVSGFLSYSNPSSNNTVTVTGLGSIWTNSSTLAVGFGDGGNSLLISDSGKVANNEGRIGQSSISSNNTVTVTGADSMWTNSGNLFVGDFGSGNSLVISNGGAVSAFYMTAGRELGANHNQVTVGSNSTITVTDKFDVGFNGSSNSLVVTDGGQVLLGSGGSSIGSFFANGNSVLVTGPGSTLSNVGIYYVGFQGARNQLTLSNQAQLISDQLAVGGSVGGGSRGSNNAVVVTGNASMGINGDLSVGREGASNSLTVSAGGMVTSANGYIGFTSTSSNNSVLVTGAGSVWTNSGTLVLGDAGSGNSLTVTDGGTVSTASIIVASQAGSGGTLNIGRSGTNDAAGTIAVPTISFGTGIGAVNFNQTNNFELTNTVTGVGSLNQFGSGALQLGGDLSSFTGSMAVAGGSIVLSNVSDLGGTVSFFLGSGGTLDVSQAGTNSISLGMSVVEGTGTILNSGGGTLVLDGNLSKSGSVLVLAGGDFVVNGQINGSGAPGSFNSDLVLGSSVTPGPTAVTINTPATYVGPTVVRRGSSLLNGAANVLPDSTVVTLGDAATDTALTVNRYDLQGFNETIGGLRSAGPADNGVAGGGTLTVSGPDATVFNGSLQGAMALVRAGAGVTTLGGASTYTGGTTLRSGRLVANNPAALGTGAVNLAGGILQLQTRVDIPSSLLWDSAAVISIANPAAGHFVNVAGRVTLTGGAVTFDLAGATLPTTPTLLLSGSNVGTLSPGDFTATGLGLQQYAITIVGNSLFISVGPSSYTQFAVTPNQRRVASALDAFQTATSGDRAVVAGALNSLEPGQFPSAFEQVMPTLYASLPSMAFNTANALNSSLFQRMWAVRVNGVGFSAAGLDLAPMPAEMGGTDDMGVFAINPSKDTKWGAFADGNGIFASAASTGSVQNYRSQSGGFTTGGSYRWNDNLSTGVYAGYQGLEAEYESGRTIDNAVRFGLFGTHAVDALYFNALVGGAYHGYTVNRYINFGGLDRTATGRPGAGEFDLALGTGYDLRAGDLTFGPFTTLQYTYVGVQGFTETGAGALNLDVEPYNSSSLLYTLGAQAAYNWRLSSRVMLTPSVFAGWQHEFLQNGYAINSSFNTGGTAAPFAYDTATPARDYFYGGAGVTVGLGERWTASFIYSAFAANTDVNSQNLYFSLGVEF